MVHVIPAHRDRPADDPIFALNREATERRARGESIVNATVGALLMDDGTLAILPTAARAVRDVSPNEWASYAPIAGDPAFLRAVADDLLGGTPALRSTAVVAATPGGSGALRHAIANFLEPGQALLTTSFFWGPYQTLADEADRRVATFPTFLPAAAGGGLDVDAFDRALGALMAEQGRALLFLNDPCHNPTGYSMRTEEWRAVVDRVRAHAAKGPVTLLVDMAYAAYAARDPRASFAELVPLLDVATLLFAWSASKTYTHYGLRVGAIVACVADPKERALTEAALSYSCRGTWSNCNHGGLAAITRLLVDDDLRRACDAERARLQATLHARVAAWNALAPARGLKYPPYEGGFFVTAFTDDAHAIAAKMKADGVFVVPQKGALRVALCSVAERDVPRLVETMAKHVAR